MATMCNFVSGKEYYCRRCKDNGDKDCRYCGCCICAKKSNPGSIVLCDECDLGYHLACLEPPLTNVPEEDEWYVRMPIDFLAITV